MEETSKNTNVVIVENHNKLVCSSVFELLAKEAFIGRVRRATTFSDASQILTKDFFTLLIVFSTHPLATLAQEISRASMSSKVKILLVLSSSDNFAMRYLYHLPVYGLLSISSDYDELLYAVKTIAIRNLKYISPFLLRSFNKSCFGDHLFSNLSRREFEVAVAILKGERNTQIAKELNISKKTVSTYRSRLFRKLEITSISQLHNHAQISGIHLPD